MDRLALWKAELKELTVSIPSSYTSYKPLEDLTERVERFLLDWDTFDNVAEMK